MSDKELRALPSNIKEVCLAKASRFYPIKKYDDYRVEDGYKAGGLALDDQEVIATYRRAFKSLLS